MDGAALPDLSRSGAAAASRRLLAQRIGVERAPRLPRQAGLHPKPDACRLPAATHPDRVFVAMALACPLRRPADDPVKAAALPSARRRRRRRGAHARSGAASCLHVVRRHDRTAWPQVRLGARATASSSMCRPTAACSSARRYSAASMRSPARSGSPPASDAPPQRRAPRSPSLGRLAALRAAARSSMRLLPAVSASRPCFKRQRVVAEHLAPPARQSAAPARRHRRRSLRDRRPRRPASARPGNPRSAASAGRATVRSADRCRAAARLWPARAGGGSGRRGPRRRRRGSRWPSLPSATPLPRLRVRASASIVFGTCAAISSTASSRMMRPRGRSRCCAACLAPCRHRPQHAEKPAVDAAAQAEAAPCLDRARCGRSPGRQVGHLLGEPAGPAVLGQAAAAAARRRCADARHRPARN